MKQQRFMITAFIAMSLLIGVFSVYLYLNNPQPAAPQIAGKPIEDLTEGYTLSQAAADGCIVVNVKKEIISGKQKWNSFLTFAESGTPTSIRLYTIYVDGSSAYSICDLRYDGEKYTQNQHFSFDNEPIDDNYKYLIFDRFINRFKCYDIVLLSDDPEMTYLKYISGFTSSSGSLQIDPTCLLFSIDISLSELKNDDILKLLEIHDITPPEDRSIEEIGNLIAKLEQDHELKLPGDWKEEEGFVNQLRAAVISYLH